jgi:CRISPR-associated protein Cas5h
LDVYYNKIERKRIKDMKALRFNINADTGMIKNAAHNKDGVCYTYAHIHFMTGRGLGGCILGLKGWGYNHIFEEESLPQFYRELHDLKIAIVPHKYNFSMQIMSTNNSTYYANYANKGTTQVIKEQWLINPSWDIYILEGHKYYDELKRRLFEGDFVYDLYIGRRGHGAFIEDVEELEVEEVKGNCFIDSLFLDDEFEVMFSRNTKDNKNPVTFNYELPLRILEDMENMRDIRIFNLTNAMTKNIGNNKVYNCCSKNVVFY